MKRIYLDHNATTPIHPDVLEAIGRNMRETFGNPSSIHAFGREAHRVLDAAREDVARLIGAQPDEIIFTSGGSESNNHAIRGALEGLDPAAWRVVTTKIEHPAVLNACRWLEDKGCRVTRLGVDESGRVELETFRAAMTPDVHLVTVMLANNDTGTVEPLAEIAAIAHEFGALIHTDAVQAVGKIPVDVRALGVDMMTLAAHKVYGPKGVGALYVRHGLKLPSFILGGKHENGRRAGTENVPLLAGFGKTCTLAAERLDARARHLSALHARLEAGVRRLFPWARVNGHPVHRLPNTLNVSFTGYDNETLLMSLDLLGIAASGGSACSTGAREPSHVLTAMGRTPEESRGTLRFSLGEGNTEVDIDETLRALEKILSSTDRVAQPPTVANVAQPPPVAIPIKGER